MDLRIDANEAWTPANVVDRIRELEPFGISAVEQPVPHADVACLAEVRRSRSGRRSCSMNRCAAGSMPSGPIEAALCDLFNLRLSKCGGFIPSLRLAQFARQHGLGYQLGCQIGETAVLSAAGRHFAGSVADLRYVEGSYDRHLVARPWARTTSRSAGAAGRRLCRGRPRRHDRPGGPGARHRLARRRCLAEVPFTVETLTASDGYPLRYRRYRSRRSRTARSSASTASRVMAAGTRTPAGGWPRRATRSRSSTAAAPA